MPPNEAKATSQSIRIHSTASAVPAYALPAITSVCQHDALPWLAVARADGSIEVLVVEQHSFGGYRLAPRLMWVGRRDMGLRGLYWLGLRLFATTLGGDVLEFVVTPNATAITLIDILNGVGHGILAADVHPSGFLVAGGEDGSAYLVDARHVSSLSGHRMGVSASVSLSAITTASAPGLQAVLRRSRAAAADTPGGVVNTRVTAVRVCTPTPTGSGGGGHHGASSTPLAATDSTDTPSPSAVALPCGPPLSHSGREASLALRSPFPTSQVLVLAGTSLGAVHLLRVGLKAGGRGVGGGEGSEALSFTPVTVVDVSVAPPRPVWSIGSIGGGVYVVACGAATTKGGPPPSAVVKRGGGGDDDDTCGVGKGGVGAVGDGSEAEDSDDDSDVESSSTDSEAEDARTVVVKGGPRVGATALRTYSAGSLSVVSIFTPVHYGGADDFAERDGSSGEGVDVSVLHTTTHMSLADPSAMAVVSSSAAAARWAAAQQILPPPLGGRFVDGAASASTASLSSTAVIVAGPDPRLCVYAPSVNGGLARTFRGFVHVRSDITTLGFGCGAASVLVGGAMDGRLVLCSLRHFPGIAPSVLDGVLGALPPTASYDALLDRAIEAPQAVAVVAPADAASKSDAAATVASKRERPDGGRKTKVQPTRRRSKGRARASSSSSSGSSSTSSTSSRSSLSRSSSRGRRSSASATSSRSSSSSSSRSGSRSSSDASDAATSVTSISVGITPSPMMIAKTKGPDAKKVRATALPAGAASADPPAPSPAAPSPAPAVATTAAKAVTMRDANAAAGQSGGGRRGAQARGRSLAFSTSIGGGILARVVEATAHRTTAVGKVCSAAGDVAGARLATAHRAVYACWRGDTVSLSLSADPVHSADTGSPPLPIAHVRTGCYAAIVDVAIGAAVVRVPDSEVRGAAVGADSVNGSGRQLKNGHGKRGSKGRIASGGRPTHELVVVMVVATSGGVVAVMVRSGSVFTEGKVPPAPMLTFATAAGVGPDALPVVPLSAAVKATSPAAVAAAGVAATLRGDVLASLQSREVTPCIRCVSVDVRCSLDGSLELACGVGAVPQPSLLLLSAPAGAASLNVIAAHGVPPSALAALMCDATAVTVAFPGSPASSTGAGKGGKSSKKGATEAGAERGGVPSAVFAFTDGAVISVRPPSDSTGTATAPSMAAAVVTGHSMFPPSQAVVRLSMVDGDNNADEGGAEGAVACLTHQGHLAVLDAASLSPVDVLRSKDIDQLRKALRPHLGAVPNSHTRHHGGGPPVGVAMVRCALQPRGGDAAPGKRGKNDVVAPAVASRAVVGAVVAVWTPGCLVLGVRKGDFFAVRTAERPSAFDSPHESVVGMSIREVLLSHLQEVGNVGLSVGCAVPAALLPGTPQCVLVLRPRNDAAQVDAERD